MIPWQTRCCLGPARNNWSVAQAPSRWLHWALADVAAASQTSPATDTSLADTQHSRSRQQRQTNRRHAPIFAKGDRSTCLVSDNAANLDNVTLYIVCQNFESLQSILVVLADCTFDTHYMSHNSEMDESACYSKQLLPVEQAHSAPTASASLWL